MTVITLSAPASNRVAGQLRQALASVGGAKVVGALAGVAAARLLGPEAKGTHAIALLVGTALATLLTGGLEVWAQRAAASDEPADIGAVMRLQRRVSLGVVLVLAAGTLAVNAILGGRWGTVILATGVMCWVSSASMTPLGLLLGQGRVGRHGAATVAGAGAYLGFVVVLTVLDIHSVALVLLGAAFGTFVTLAGAHQRRACPVDAVVRAVEWRPALRFGVGSMVGELAALLSLRVDIFVVAALATVSDAGVYAVALAVTEVLLLAPNAVAMLVITHSARSADRASVRRIALLTTAVTALAALMLGALAPIYIPVVFGSDFDGAIGLIWFLGAAGTLGAGSKVLVADLLGAGVSRPRMTSALNGLVSMMAVDAVLVPRYGATGAAIGSVIGAAVTLAIVYQAWCRR